MAHSGKECCAEISNGRKVLSPRASDGKQRQNRLAAEASPSRTKSLPRFLGRPLRRDLILGADVAPIAEIDFETRESGNLLRGEGGGAKGSRVFPCAVLAQ